MKLTAAHWGTYRLGPDGRTLDPLPDDPDPSRVGRGWMSAALDRQSRILRPAIRRGWLAGDRGAARGGDGFVEVPWDEALDLAAAELARVRDSHGNGAIFGGSYGWSSAGRFHHAQSQLRRFLNAAGGCVGIRDTYSHAAGEVLFPHVIGLSGREFQDEMTWMSQVSDHCTLLLAFGGISPRTAQVASSGTTRHEVGPWLAGLRARGLRMINVSPRAEDLEGAEWLSIRPGTDVALMLALAHEVVAAGAEDRDFLARATSGWPEWRAYLMGETDGQARSADWAGPICGLDPAAIRALARDLAQSRTMVSLAWSLQRADHGEQPVWAALGLAAVLGQIGRPGGGFSFGYGSVTPIGRGMAWLPWPSLPQGRNPVADFIPVARIADMLLHPGATYRYDLETRVYPDIRLIWWAGGNPFHHHQDLRRLERAWTRPETVIVNDHSWTATARRADIVLPATTPLEREDLMINRRDPALVFMSQAFAPLGEARDDYRIFAGLAERLGCADTFTEGRDERAWLDHLWQETRRVGAAHGLDLPGFDDFRAAGRFEVTLEAAPVDAFARFRADPAASPLATESGRITLFNRRIAEADLKGCPGHPAWLAPAESLIEAAPDELHLISHQPWTRLHSQNDRGAESLGDKIDGREAAWLHPDAARARGLTEGCILRIWNARGACLAGLRLDPRLRPDCLVLPTGAWYDPQIVAGNWLEVHGNPNALTLDLGTSELAQGSIAHTALVRVERWTGPLPALTIDRPPPGIAPG